MLLDYGNKKYWDQRYQDAEDFFDWFQSYESLKPYMEDFFKQKGPDSMVMNVGCGTSEFGIVSVHLIMIFELILTIAYFIYLV